MINNNRRTYLISFIIRQTITRSLMTLCKDYSLNAKRTHLTTSQAIFIPARFVGEKPVATCIGKACEPFVARARNSSAPTSAVTTTAPSTEVSNAAAELMGNPKLPNARLPSVDITPSEVPNVPAHTVVPSNVVNDAINNMAPAIKHGKVESKMPYSSIETKEDSSVNDPSLTQQYELSKLTTERQPTPCIDKLLKVEKPQKNVEANSTTGKAPENNVNIPNTETTPMPTGFSGNSTSSAGTGLFGNNNTITRTPLNVENTKLVPHTDIRGMAAYHGGTYAFPPDRVMASNDNLPVAQGDHSGYHDVAVVTGCPKPGCVDQNCATETQLSTGTHQPNPCGESAEYHQEPIKEHPLLVHEVAGIITSKTPANMVCVPVDTVNIAGKNKSQEVAVEAGTMPVDPAEFTENPKATAYLQNDKRTETLLNNLPPDSSLNLPKD
jgi:hypothetical protein